MNMQEALEAEWNARAEAQRQCERSTNLGFRIAGGIALAFFVLLLWLFFLGK